MGCNCGKSKPPTGSGTKTPPPPPSSGTTQSFVLVPTYGRTQTFGSRLEAEAARTRAGGGSIQPA